MRWEAGAADGPAAESARALDREVHRVVFGACPHGNTRYTERFGEGASSVVCLDCGEAAHMLPGPPRYSRDFRATASVIEAMNGRGFALTLTQALDGGRATTTATFAGPSRRHAGFESVDIAEAICRAAVAALLVDPRT